MVSNRTDARRPYNPTVSHLDSDPSDDEEPTASDVAFVGPLGALTSDSDEENDPVESLAHGNDSADLVNDMATRVQYASLHAAGAGPRARGPPVAPAAALVRGPGRPRNPLAPTFPSPSPTAGHVTRVARLPRAIAAEVRHYLSFTAWAERDVTAVGHPRRVFDRACAHRWDHCWSTY